jgi:Flp pilus assembly protein TadG
VEFALIVPLLALLVLGILDFGRVFYSYEALVNAAREGARYCALHAEDAEPGRSDGTRARITGELDGRVTPDLSLTRCPLDSLPLVPGDAVTVRVSTSIVPVTPLIGGLVGNPIVVSASATMPLWLQ